jgi:hypothetical protein
MIARPILFSGSMIRALLAGTKTQTRRPIKLQTGDTFDERSMVGAIQERRPVFHTVAGQDVGTKSVLVRCPYGMPGDALWAKETWQAQEAFDTMSPTAIGEAFEAEHGEPWCPIRYLADGHCDGSVDQWQESPVGKTRVSIHMPRWASRLTLPITAVRVERLHDISEADAKAEGIVETRPADKDGWRHFGVPGMEIDQPTAARAYLALWTAINGQASTDANPWVWTISFEVHRDNVDAYLAASAKTGG